MTLIEDARALSDTEPLALVGADGDERWQCSICDAESEAVEPPPSTRHAPDCPWLALPRIAAALLAAERMVAGRGLGVRNGFVEPSPDEECWRCIACHAETAWTDGAVPSAFNHEASCSGQALITALRGGVS